MSGKKLGPQQTFSLSLRLLLCWAETCGVPHFRCDFYEGRFLIEPRYYVSFLGWKTKKLKPDKKSNKLFSIGGALFYSLWVETCEEPHLRHDIYEGIFLIESLMIPHMTKLLIIFPALTCTEPFSLASFFWVGIRFFTTGIEPVTVGWEARTLPLCYAFPLNRHS